MIFGAALHSLLLEMDKFTEEFVVEPNLYELPKLPLLKNVGREIYEQQKKMRADIEEINKAELDKFYLIKENKKVVSWADFMTLATIKEEVLKHPQVYKLLQGKIETSYVWQDEHSELLLKCRPDILQENAIVDIKSCRDASPRAFQRAMVEYGYHVQGAMIQDAVQALEGRKIAHVINIAIEKEYPHEIGIYIIDDAALDAGRALYKQACVDLKHAITYNKFDSYPTQLISLPKWAMQEN